MVDQSSYGKIRILIPVLALMAVALVAIFGVYLSIPVKQHHAAAPAAAAPDPTAQAIRDLQTTLQQAVDQLKALQQTVSSDRAEIRRLSEEVTALTGKLEALQKSFASAQPAPVPQPTEPARQKRGGR
jgi:uncharacterized protein HemX